MATLSSSAVATVLDTTEDTNIPSWSSSYKGTFSTSLSYYYGLSYSIPLGYERSDNGSSMESNRSVDLPNIGTHFIELDLSTDLVMVTKGSIKVGVNARGGIENSKKNSEVASADSGIYLLGHHYYWLDSSTDSADQFAAVHSMNQLSLSSITSELDYEDISTQLYFCYSSEYIDTHLGFLIGFTNQDITTEAVQDRGKEAEITSGISSIKNMIDRELTYIALKPAVNYSMQFGGVQLYAAYAPLIRRIDGTVKIHVTGENTFSSGSSTPTGLVKKEKRHVQNVAHYDLAHEVAAGVRIVKNKFQIALGMVSMPTLSASRAYIDIYSHELAFENLAALQLKVDLNF